MICVDIFKSIEKTLTDLFGQHIFVYSDSVAEPKLSTVYKAKLVPQPDTTYIQVSVNQNETQSLIDLTQPLPKNIIFKINNILPSEMIEITTEYSIEEQTDLVMIKFKVGDNSAWKPIIDGILPIDSISITLYDVAFLELSPRTPRAPFNRVSAKTIEIETSLIVRTTEDRYKARLNGYISTFQSMIVNELRNNIDYVLYGNTYNALVIDSSINYLNEKQNITSTAILTLSLILKGEHITAT